ncbi:MAG: hypothetical protein P1V97_27210 [Planctomycetota bacterium]|nr:hypothetical protein [Planctomycetota bacterium]
MFQKLITIAVALLLCFTGGCSSSPKNEIQDHQNEEAVIESSEDMDSKDNSNSEPFYSGSYVGVSSGVEEDLGLLGKSATPVSNEIFWVSTGIFGLPLFVLAFPIQQAGDLSNDIYKPAFLVGNVAGGVIVAPFYLVEKSYVTTKDNFTDSGS